jgi:very-short-patch-repair endonuclease
LKLAIEVDGVSHLVGDTRKYDRERQAYVEQLGITFLRFWNTEIYHNLDEVLEVIRKKIVDLSKQSAARLQSAG